MRQRSIILPSARLRLSLPHLSPEEQTAQEPLAERAGSLALRLDSAQGASLGTLLLLREFPEESSDLTICSALNNTRVFPARDLRTHDARETAPSRSPVQQSCVPADFCRNGGSSSLPGRYQCEVPTTGIGLEASWVAKSVWEKHRSISAKVQSFQAGGPGPVALRRKHGLDSLPVQDFFKSSKDLGHVPLPPHISREDRACRPGTPPVRPSTPASAARWLHPPPDCTHSPPNILSRLRERGDPDR